MKSETILTEVKNSAWFRKWFDTGFYHRLYANRDEKEAAGFIEELLDELRPPQNSIMLDLGCGAGRHAKYLASKGFSVTGLDLAASSIRMAKKFETTQLHFARHDMREPFGKKQFDYVFNFFTSFGYFKTDRENYLVIRNIYNALKPGGIIMMDYMNANFSEQHLVPFEEKEIDGIVYRISRWTDDRYFFKKIEIDEISTGAPVEFTEQITRFSVEEFKYLFGSNGFQIQEIYGDYHLHDYDENTSPRLILIAKK